MTRAPETQVRRAIRAVLDATQRKGLTILTQHDGKPLRYRSAADDVMAVREAIGAMAWDLHSLRYSAASELARLGCTDEQIAAITGHSSLAMVKKYAGAERQLARAKEVKGIRE
jgi:integrase